MKCSRPNLHLLSLLLASSLVFLSACAGIQDIPDSEKKYIEGVVVEGGVYGFRLKDDGGEVFRFITRNHVTYQPADLNAFFGDRVGVSYYSVVKKGQERHEALSVKLLSSNPDRIDLSYGSVEGIMRAVGMMRYLVYLPEKDLTVAFYKDNEVKYSPQYWMPRTGNRGLVYFSHATRRYFRRFKCTHISRLGEDLAKIQDRIETGEVTDILADRMIHKIPDRFVFKPQNGNAVTIYAGGETRCIPQDIRVDIGVDYKIRYYALLMGDYSLRHVATQVKR